MTIPRPAPDSVVPFKASSSISLLAICSTYNENRYWAEESPPRGGHGRSFSTRAPRSQRPPEVTKVITPFLIHSNAISRTICLMRALCTGQIALEHFRKANGTVARLLVRLANCFHPFGSPQGKGSDEKCCTPLPLPFGTLERALPFLLNLLNIVPFVRVSLGS